MSKRKKQYRCYSCDKEVSPWELDNASLCEKCAEVRYQKDSWKRELELCETLDDIKDFLLQHMRPDH